MNRADIRKNLVLKLKEKTIKPCVVCLEGEEGIGKTNLINKAVEQSGVNGYLRHQLNERHLPVLNIFKALLPQLLEKAGLKEEKQFFTNSSAISGTNLTSLRDLMVKSIKSINSRGESLIVVIEALHYADATSYELLTLLFEVAEGLSFMIILTYNQASLAHPNHFLKLKGFLRKNGFLAEYSLRPLSIEEGREMIESKLNQKVGPKLLKLVHEKSGGNPYFIGEIIESLKLSNNLLPDSNGVELRHSFDIPLPDTIKEMVMMQMADLSQEANYALEVAAMAGQDFDFSVLSEVVDQDISIDELLRIGLLTEHQPAKGTFRHRIVQEVVFKEIIWSRRKTISKKLAEIYERFDQKPELIGQFWEIAGERHKARKAYVKAARMYCSNHAHWDAVYVANKALEMWPDAEEEEERIDTLQRLAQCTQVSGQLLESIKALKEILASPIVQKDLIKKAETLRSLAKAFALQGTWQKSNDYRYQSAQVWEQSGSFIEATKDWIDLSNRRLDGGDMVNALQAAEAAVVAAEKSDNPGFTSKSLSIRAYILSILGKLKEAKKDSEQAIQIAEKLEDKEVIAYAYRKLAGVLELSSNFVESIKVYDSALNFCQREDLNMQAVFCMSCMSWVLFRLGDWKKALEVSNEVILDQETNNASKSIAQAVSALIRAHRGEVKSAAGNIRSSYELAKKESYQLIIFIQIWAEAVTEEMNGNERYAYFNYKKLMDEWYHKGDVHDVLGGLFAAGTFFYHHNYRQEINETLKIVDQIVNITGNPEAIGFLHYLQALIALQEGNTKVAKTHLEDSKLLLLPVNIPLQMVYLEFHEALVAKESGDFETALNLLHKVIANARNMGMRLFASRAEKMMQKIKVNDPQIENGNKAHSLTPRQMDILHELSAGLSNKEIASRLNLSTRTVDMHVRNIFDHLNCRSRTEAVKIAGDKGLLA